MRRRDRAARRQGGRRPAELRILTANLDVGPRPRWTSTGTGSPGRRPSRSPSFPTGPRPALGFRVKETPLPDGKGTVLEVDQVVRAAPRSRPACRPGMKILGVGRRPSRSLAEFDAAVNGFNFERGLPLFVLTPDGQTAESGSAAPCPIRRRARRRTTEIAGAMQTVRDEICTPRTPECWVLSAESLGAEPHKAATTHSPTVLFRRTQHSALSTLALSTLIRLGAQLEHAFHGRRENFCRALTWTPGSQDNPWAGFLGNMKSG